MPPLTLELAQGCKVGQPSERIAAENFDEDDNL
jgi:hypothetical protein